MKSETGRTGDRLGIGWTNVNRCCNQLILDIQNFQSSIKLTPSFSSLSGKNTAPKARAIY